MKIRFLGTGTSQGIPVIACECAVCRSSNSMDKRLRSSVLIEEQGKTFVIDTGPDFRQQMLREKVKKLDFLLFTHAHKDHTAGLDDIRSFNWLTKKPMDIYAEQPVLDHLRIEFSYAFAEQKYPGIPDMLLHPVTTEPFDVQGIQIIPVRGIHMHLPVLGFRIGNFAYLTDVNFVPENELSKLEGLDVLVVNALRKKKHVSHFNLEEALAFAKKVKAGKTLLTHISHLMGFHEEVNRELPSGISLAHDGLVLNL